MRSVGGTLYALIALAFVSAANFGTAITGIYASALGLRNFRILRNRSWTALLLMTLAPVAAVGIVIPDLFFSKFGSFLALIGVGFAPLCGVQIADYFFVRRGQVDVRGLFRTDAHSPYYFWRGFNPAAIGAFVLGCGAYIALLNPLSYASSPLYRYVTASLPATLIAAVTYVFLARWASGIFQHTASRS
jgi:NCS1 family nucleobase:cation symporter-1